MLHDFGLPIGIALLLAVTALSVLLIRQAAGSVERFREEHHEAFRDRSRP